MAGSIDVTKYATLSDYYHDIVKLAGGSASGLYYIAWIFYYPLNEALPYIALIWFVLGVAICYLLSRSLDEPASSPSSVAYGGQIKDKEQEPPIEPKDTRVMNDDEARYLIDQFNKFTSYRMGATQFELSIWAVVLAISAILFSEIPIAWRGAQPDIMTIEVFPLMAFGIVIFAILAVFHHCYKADRIHKDDVDILMALESHRSRYKRLPDTITLERVTHLGFKAEDLRKLLREDEPSPTSPQT
jgi:hypothetical protein